MNEEIVYKVNTRILREAINDKYGGVSNFVAKTKYNEKSIYKWLKSGDTKSSVLFEMADILGIDDMNTLRKKEIIYIQI